MAAMVSQRRGSVNGFQRTVFRATTRFCPQHGFSRNESLLAGLLPIEGGTSETIGMTTPDEGTGQIETTRLILRQPKLSDAVAMFERYASDPEVTRFLGWPRHRSVRDTETFLQFSAQEWKR